jgi:hypothetical protein
MVNDIKIDLYFMQFTGWNKRGMPFIIMLSVRVQSQASVRTEQALTDHQAESAGKEGNNGN